MLLLELLFEQLPELVQSLKQPLFPPKFRHTSPARQELHGKTHMPKTQLPTGEHWLEL
jgi:hypothetical protein